MIMSQKNDVLAAKAKLKILLKELKGIEGIGVTVENNGDSHVVVNMTRRSFNKNVKFIPQNIDGFIIDTQIVSRASFQKTVGKGFLRRASSLKQN